MKEQKYGRILTCASGAAFGAPVGTTAYGMNKAAIVIFPRYAAQEWGRFNITTNCFPPVTKNEHYGKEGESPVTEEMVARAIPVGYMGDPYEDASQIQAFLVSEGAHYINGEVFGISGGLKQQ